MASKKTAAKTKTAPGRTTAPAKSRQADEAPAVSGAGLFFVPGPLGAPPKPRPKAPAVTTTTRPLTLSSEDDPDCPVCGAKMWDNRADKAAGRRNERGPDFKCKTRTCDGVIWPQRGAVVHTVHHAPSVPNVAGNGVTARPEKGSIAERSESFFAALARYLGDPCIGCGFHPLKHAKTCIVAELQTRMAMEYAMSDDELAIAASSLAEPYGA